MGFLQEKIAALRNAYDGEMAERNALHFFDRMQILEERAAENLESGAGGVDFVPKIGGAATRGVGLADSAEARAGFFAQTIQFIEREAALDLDVIDLRELGPGFKNGGGEIAIVGEEDEAGVSVVQRADGIDALGKAAEEIAERAAALGIGEGGDDFGRFVEEEINVIFFGSDEAAGSFDFVFGGIGFGAEFRDDLTVDAHLAGEDELFGVAPGGDASVGDDFLEAVEHGRREISDIRDQRSGNRLLWWSRHSITRWVRAVGAEERKKRATTEIAESRRGGGEV